MIACPPKNDEHDAPIQAVEVTPEAYHRMVKHDYVVAMKFMRGCQNTLQTPAPQVLTPKPDAPRPSEAPQPFTSVGLSHTSTNSLASGTGRTTHVTLETKAQQTGWPENKSALKALCTDASSQSTVSSMLAVPTVGIPAKTPAEKCIPPPCVKPFAPSQSIPSATLTKPPVTAPKSILSTRNTLTTAVVAVGKSSHKNQPVVGLDRLVIITCEKRRQTYCLLCSVLVRHHDHMASNGHRYKYMKLRYPDWTMQAETEMDKRKLLNMVTYLAEIEKEKGIVPKRVAVNTEHYNRLKVVSADKGKVRKLPQALSCVMVMGVSPREALAEVKELVESLSHPSTAAAEGGNPEERVVSGSRGASRSADGVEPNPGAPRPPSPPASVVRGAAVSTPKPPLISNVRPGRLFEQSNLSRFLGVDHQGPIIGLAFVIEVRGISQGTFCLCGACSQTLPIKLMCQHMESSDHQHTYLLKHYPQFMSWWGQDFPPEKKEGLLRDIAWMISERECFDKNDAKVIIVHKDYYDYIRTAPFSQALDMLRNICREEKLCRLFAFPKRLGPPASDAPARGEPRSAHASKESSAREKVPGVSQHTVDREPALPVVGQYCESLMDVSCKRMCAIVECSCEEQTPYYLCVACGNILSRGLVLLHIQSSRHVRQYMSERYPWCFEGVVWAGRAGDLPAEFLQRARELVEQNHDEPGTMQRIPLPLEEFNRIRTMTFDEALSRLHTISRNHSQSELLTCVTSKPRPAVKHAFEDGPADSHKAKHRRLSSPPPTDPRLAARSHLTESKKKASGEAGKPLLSQVHEPAPGLRGAQPGSVEPQVSSSVTSVTNCPAGSFAGPASYIGVIGDASNTSNPHAENTAKPGALLPQKDLGFQRYSRLIQRLKEPATTGSSLPIGGSTAPLAANLSATDYSSRSTSAQSSSLPHSVTETTACSQDYSTGQPYYVPSLYPATAYVDYDPASVPMPVYNTSYNHPLYFANVNHTPVFLSRGQFASQLPIQRQCIMSAWGQTPEATFHSVTPATAASLREMASTYQGLANYSHVLPRAGTYSNNIVISNPNLPQSTSNCPEVQGFQATTSYNLTSAPGGVVTSEGHSQDVADFYLSTGHANGQWKGYLVVPQ